MFLSVHKFKQLPFSNPRALVSPIATAAARTSLDSQEQQERQTASHPRPLTDDVLAYAVSERARSRSRCLETEERAMVKVVLENKEALHAIEDRLQKAVDHVLEGNPKLRSSERKMMRNKLTQLTSCLILKVRCQPSPAHHFLS